MSGRNEEHEPHDWKKMYPDPETNSTPVSNTALFWFIAGALSMLGVLGFVAYIGSSV